MYNTGGYPWNPQPGHNVSNIPKRTVTVPGAPDWNGGGNAGGNTGGSWSGGGGSGNYSPPSLPGAGAPGYPGGSNTGNYGVPSVPGISGKKDFSDWKTRPRVRMSDLKKYGLKWDPYSQMYFTSGGKPYINGQVIGGGSGVGGGGQTPEVGGGNGGGSEGDNFNYDSILEQIYAIYGGGSGSGSGIGNGGQNAAGGGQMPEGIGAGSPSYLNPRASFGGISFM